MPREHGAYAQLGFPLLTGLIYAQGDPAAFGFAVAGLSLFFAHEPVAVLAGVRGVRLRESLAGPAKRRLLLLGAAAVLGLVVAAALAPTRAWLAAAIPGGLAVLLLPLLGTKRLKSLPGEYLVAAVFSTSVLPLALTHQTTWGPAVIAAVVWFAAVAPAIPSVHAIKIAFKGTEKGRWTLAGAPIIAGAVAVAGVVGALVLPARQLLAVLPPAAAVLALAWIRPHPKHLKRVGWTMVVADLSTLVLLLML